MSVADSTSTSQVIPLNYWHASRAVRGPGNVRQLLHEVERLVALSPEGAELTSAHCSLELMQASTDVIAERLRFLMI